MALTAGAGRGFSAGGGSNPNAGHTAAPTASNARLCRTDYPQFPQVYPHLPARETRVLNSATWTRAVDNGSVTARAD